MYGAELQFLGRRARCSDAEWTTARGLEQHETLRAANASRSLYGLVISGLSALEAYRAERKLSPALDAPGAINKRPLSVHMIIAPIFQFVCWKAASEGTLVARTCPITR